MARAVDSCNAFDGPLLGVWKSRLPALALPVLAGLHQIHPSGLAAGGWPVSTAAAWSTWWQILLVFGVVLSTGYWRLPFSVTWWLVLLLALALGTEFLVGVAVVMSLLVILCWYGTRLFYPHSISVLWGGLRSDAADCFGPDGCTMSLWAWKLWDLCVHAVPAVLMLYWHGPGVSLQDCAVRPGIASARAVATAAPLGMLWFLGLQLGLPYVARRSWRLGDTNLAYRMSPNLPERTWLLIHGAPWVLCPLWIGLLVLPRDVIVVYAAFVGMGVTRQPYTLGWWVIFLAATLTTRFSSLMEGTVWCTALTTGVGFYGVQVLAPYAFDSLVHSVLERQRWWAPRCLYTFADMRVFPVAARLADVCLHLLPLSFALYRYIGSVTAAAALVALPTNLTYLLATGYRKLSDTNKIYQVEPPLPQNVWNFIYGSHIVLCSSIWLVCAVTAPSGLHASQA